MTTSFHTDTAQPSGCLLELQTKVRKDFTIMENACNRVKCLIVQHSVLNLKASIGGFNQMKVLMGTYSVIVQSLRTFV